MAKQWEITGRLGELQLDWLKRHYDEETLNETLRKLPKKGFPLNVAKKLYYEGKGPRMPSADELLRDDPQSQQQSREVALEQIQRIKRMLKS